MKFIYLIFLIFSFVAFSYGQKASAEKKVVYVTGDVIKPSGLLLIEGMTLTQAINQAGGLKPKNKGKIVSIYRLIPPTKEREIIKVSLKEIEKEKAEDLILQPLDIIEVEPRKKSKTNFGCPFEFCL